ncbi:hypothetical protein ACFQ5N_03695 [Lutibacter holmesii]|uniref:Uncharacterized protein n=1 Tax=Lutibacter holmesii TaxID=1137985 RepID=A0ABW3WLZ4_9FLAO
MKKLNSYQIQQLYTFTRAHFVEYYDVQTELVDHLANDIEQIWQEQPHLTFEDTRTISFKKFGVFGFMDVVEARTKALNKKYWKLVWGFFKEFFKIPQVISTAVIFMVIYFSFILVPNHTWVYVSIGFSICAVLIVRLFQLQQLKKQRFKQTNKKWLLEEYILNSGNIASFAYVIFSVPLNLKVQLTASYQIALMSLFFTSYLLLIYIITFVLPQKAEEILENQYPEYKLV